MSAHPERTPAAALTGEQQDALVDQAFAIERRVRSAIGTIKGGTWQLAQALHEFNAICGWERLGYESLNEWLAQPEISLSAGWFSRLVGLWEQLVLVKNVAPAQLSRIDVSAASEVLPAIRKGRVSVAAALSDAERLGRHDLRERYRAIGRGQDDALDAASEPIRATCPCCGAWTTADRVEAFERERGVEGAGS